MKKKIMSNQNSKNVVSNQDSNGRFLRGTHWREPKPYWNREWLFDAYVVQKQSAADIAKLFGCSDNNILYFLHKHKITRRTVSEVRAIKKWGLSGKTNGMYGKCGSQNPRWIDGSSPERQTIYARSFWKEIIKAVYKRDGYKCLRCRCDHTTKNRLHAHHIKPWAGNVDERFDLRNIITVCQKCHNWIHSRENVDDEYLSY